MSPAKIANEIFCKQNLLNKQQFLQIVLSHINILFKIIHLYICFTQCVPWIFYKSNFTSKCLSRTNLLNKQTF